MFASLSRGWSLTKTSFKVLKLDKEILALPFMSGILLILVTASILLSVGIFALDGPVLIPIVFGLYVASYFVILWFNAAVIEMATIRFNGGDPILKDGLRKAWSKKWRILQWAVVAATVGLILKILDNMARQSNNDMVRIVGQIGVWIAGAAWNIATFFVMPILIYQDLGPFQAIKSSLGTWKRTWGEGFAATFTAGLIFLLLGLLGLLPLYLAMNIGGVVAWVVFAFVAVYWITLSAVNMAVNGIIVAALYKFAVDGRLPEAFDDAQLGVPSRNYA